MSVVLTQEVERWSIVSLGEVADLARTATSILFNASGASAIQDSVAIQRYHRDLQSLSLHGIIQPTTVRELYGRMLCGLPPNTPFV